MKRSNIFLHTSNNPKVAMDILPQTAQDTVGDEPKYDIAGLKSGTVFVLTAMPYQCRKGGQIQPSADRQKHQKLLYHR